MHGRLQIEFAGQGLQPLALGPVPGDDPMGNATAPGGIFAIHMKPAAIQVSNRRIRGLGFFEDERAVAEWRNRPEHRRAQALGRDRLFSRYRLRMARVTRDYGSDDRHQAPADSRAHHDAREDDSDV